jgi:hypothetical protein
MRITRTKGVQRARVEYENNTWLLSRTTAQLEAAAFALGVSFLWLYDRVEAERKQRQEKHEAAQYIP